MFALSLDTLDVQIELFGPSMAGPKTEPITRPQLNRTKINRSVFCIRLCPQGIESRNTILRIFGGSEIAVFKNRYEFGLDFFIFISMEHMIFCELQFSVVSHYAEKFVYPRRDQHNFVAPFVVLGL